MHGERTHSDKQIAVIAALAEGHDTGDKTYPVTVLHIHPALTPAAAVRAFIAQEFRNAQA